MTVKPNFTVENVKKIAVIHFYGQNTTKPISRYRLVHSSKFKQLVDENYIDDEDINEYGIFIKLYIFIYSFLYIIFFLINFKFVIFIYYLFIIFVIINNLFIVTDELLLVEIRSSIVQENLSDEALKGPSLEVIAQTTKGLSSQNVKSKSVPSTECPADVNIFYIFYKILIIIILLYLFIITYSFRMKFVRF